MTNEELILEKLERLETQIQPLIKTSEKFAELKNDLISRDKNILKKLEEESE